ncbi:MAG: hypothetical protein HGA22_13380, partial [Clostridiales bacterium]|nr:hypothetical protein [Clostridiales bacterium]
MSSNFNRNLKGFLAVTVMLAMLFTCVCGAYAQPGGMGGNMGGMGGGMQQNQSNMPNQQNQQPGQDIQETEYSEVTLSGSTPSDGGEIA